VGERDRPDPGRIVADADVLVADLLVGGPAREAMDLIRAHSWLELVVTDELLDDAEAILRELTDDDLADDWRRVVETLATVVDQPGGDHPALAAAYRGGAAHLLTFDESLRSARAGAELRAHVETSVKSPDAFLTVFDPERLHSAVVGGEYPGPDRDPHG
jgi:predicted nucleic acid-binding protein